MKKHILYPLKRILFFAILLSTLYILEYGFTFTFDFSSKLLRPFSLSILAIIMIFRPNSKPYILLLVGVCFILMILTYFFNLLDFSNMIGSFGFSLLVITIFLYLPQIIKNGHIEKF